jgi:LAGLIDADG endonuclease
MTLGYLVLQEGCFNVKIDKRPTTVTGFRVMLRFILDQKNSQYLFLQLRDLFSYGAVSFRGATKGFIDTKLILSKD